MPEIFSVKYILFTVMGYPMSAIELVGTLCYLWSVWLISRKNMLTWPVGIVSVLLFMVLFYQIRLYSDALEQVYYLGASAYGWWYWQKNRNETERDIAVFYSEKRWILAWIAITFVVSMATGMFMANVHTIFPALFPEPASLPFLDALTTIMSFTAMWLMARRKTESWIYWIVVDVIGIGLYYYKEVKFIALLYVILLAMAVNGLVSWHRSKSSLTDRAV